MSERHACRLVGLSRDSYRHAPVASAQTAALKTKIVEIAHARRIVAMFRADPTRPLVYEGKLVELPTIKRVERIADL